MRSLSALEASRLLEHPWKLLHFSSLQEKYFHTVTPSQSARTLSVFFDFLINQISRAFSAPSLSLPPPFWVDFNLFFSEWLLVWAEQSGWTGSWAGLLVSRGRGMQGRGPVYGEWSLVFMGPPTASQRGLQWHATGKVSSAWKKELSTLKCQVFKLLLSGCNQHYVTNYSGKKLVLFLSWFFCLKQFFAHFSFCSTV